MKKISIEQVNNGFIVRVLKDGNEGSIFMATYPGFKPNFVFQDLDELIKHIAKFFFKEKSSDRSGTRRN